MIEVLKQMVEAMLWIEPCDRTKAIEDAIKAGKQAIAKLESQEPEACGTYQEVTDTMNALWAGTLEQVQIAEEMKNKKLYTAPPQRTWVGLTNNELQPIADEYRILFGSWVEDFAKAIEAKLKEKNCAG